MSIKEDIKGLRAKQYKMIVGKTLCHFMESSMYSKALSYVVFGFSKKNVHPEVDKNPKNPRTSSVFGTNSKQFSCKVCTPRGRITRGLAV